MNKERFLDRIQRKLGRFAISNLMLYIVGGMAVVFVMDTFIFPSLDFNLTAAIMFDRNAVFSGQVWRLITFVLIPPDASIIFIFFSLYFYWLIGTALETQWGSFKFNAFYLCGAICTVLVGLITGYATNYYLNMSLFLAFAILYPNFEILLFFVLPVKIKYIAIIDAILLGVSFAFSSWMGKITLLIAIGNLILFFWKDFFYMIKDWKRRRDFKKNWKN